MLVLKFFTLLILSLVLINIINYKYEDFNSQPVEDYRGSINGNLFSLKLSDLILHKKKSTIISTKNSQCHRFVLLLLILSGDVEVNPGPGLPVKVSKIFSGNRLVKIRYFCCVYGKR